MRLLKLLTWVLLGGVIAVTGAAAAAQSSSRQPGHIVAAKVQGSVVATNLTDQSQIDLQDGTTITQNYVVTTGAGSGVILLLSNGATLNLGPDSSLSIDEFLQDPFSDEMALADLKEEPTTSVTKLNLARGELVGNVKRIRQEAGSSFTVATPVGAAGIRGTTFRIVFRPGTDGRAFFTLSTAEGRVVYEPPAAAAVPVASGSEVVVTVEVQVNAATGAVTLTAPPVVSAVQDIPPATQAAIAASAQQIVEVAATAIIVSTQQGTDRAEADRAAAESSDEQGAADEQPPADEKEAEKTETKEAAQEKDAKEQVNEERSPAGEREPDTEPATLPTEDPPPDAPPPAAPPENLSPPPAPPPTTPLPNTTPGDGL